METKTACSKSIPKLLQNRSLDGLHYDNPSHRFFKNTIPFSQSLYKRDLLGHFGCVNAIEFSSNGELIASGGDDRRLLLWKVWRTIFDGTAPVSIDTQHVSNINSCSFDCTTETVVTGGSDGQVIVHDIATLKTSAVYGLTDTVFCLSPDPINTSNIAIASDDGKVQILDMRSKLDSGFCIIADLGASMHSVMFNPSEPRLLATANSKHGITLWDVRKPRNVFMKSSIQNCMSVRFNNRGDQLLALRRRGCPVLYDMKTFELISKFDYKTYYNACTLKSACFAGLQDEYVVSGSDDFCVYLWRIPDSSCYNSEPHMILKGHRSIVNQVRYCPYNQMILSSGVEKLIKMWTPYALPGSTGRLHHSRRYGDDDESERNAYSHDEYIHMVLRAGSFLSHDYSNGNTDEEPCMIAFFDSLIQREVEQSAGESDFGSDNDREQNSGNLHVSGNELESTEIDFVTTTSRTSSGRRNPRLASVTNEEQESRLNNRNEGNSQPDLDSSSDSASEVDEILTAMYNRYMHSRDQTIGASGPSGKKISSVIALRKYKDKCNTCKEGDEPPRVDSHHNGNICHEDQSRSMSVFADVIDNFVDNLVASDFSSNHSLSDTNDGGMYDISPTDLNDFSSLTDLPTVNPPGTRNGHMNSSPILPPLSPPVASNNCKNVNSKSSHNGRRKDRDLYFAPELEAFSSHISSTDSDSDGSTKRERISRLKSLGLKPFHTLECRTASSSESSESDKSDLPNFITDHSHGKKRQKASSANVITNSARTSSSLISSKQLCRGKDLASSVKTKNELQASEFSFDSHLPSSSSLSHPSTSHVNKYFLDCPGDTIKEKVPVIHAEDYESDSARDSTLDKKSVVTFKKVRKSKQRRFRKHTQKDSCTSSEDEER